MDEVQFRQEQIFLLGYGPRPLSRGPIYLSGSGLHERPGQNGLHERPG
jgi:hypothetical protein